MAKSCYGVDVGGTTVKLGYFSPEGVLEKKWEIVTRTENNGEAILPDIAAALKEDMAMRGLTPEDVIGVGIGIPGPVTADGVVNKCVNLGWPVVPVEKELSELFYGILVKAGNDANVAAMGEAYYGGGRGYDNMIMVTLGTGIGGAVILGGRMLSGSAGAAGEIGHLPIYPQAKRDCSCGNRGCLEQIGSATGIVNRAKELLEETDLPSALRGRTDITAKDVLDLHDADPLAEQVLEDVTDALGRGLATVAGVVDPQAFVIGGGVSKAGQWFMDRIESRFQKYAFHACRGAKVLKAELGNDAGMYGAAALVRQAAER